MKLIKSYLLCVVALSVFACSNDDNGGEDKEVEKSEVIQNYANIVYTSYNDSYEGAVLLQTAVDAFIANPSEANFNTTKKAWLAAREPYGQTEAYRECNGPIDAGGESWSIENEGRLNAWPLEEALIDYVLAATEAQGAGSFSFNNIISDDSITIDENTVISYNEYEQNEAAVSTGWHAIEFLLWGQDNTDPKDNLPGQRMFTDYTTAGNANRRASYLKIVTDLLVKDLKNLVDTWKTGGAYRTVFDALKEDTALKQLINGAFFIAGDELSSERMIAPVNSNGGYNGWGQEDEHSCFSDNTHRDIFTNAKGVYNVIFGEYGTIKGASFYDLVRQANATQAEKLKSASDEAMAKVAVIVNNDKPFDYLITKEVSTNTSGPVMQAVVALQAWGDEISASASIIQINLN